MVMLAALMAGVMLAQAALTPLVDSACLCAVPGVVLAIGFAFAMTSAIAAKSALARFASRETFPYAD